MPVGFLARLCWLLAASVKHEQFYGKDKVNFCRSWVAALVHGRFSYGLNRVGALQVFTSSGVGTWGMPMRVGTKSEIVLLRFEPTEEKER